jgi:hypothetical protein
VNADPLLLAGVAAAAAILAAGIGAAASIISTRITLKWTARHDIERLVREEAARVRSEKRTAYAEVVASLDAHRDATATVAEANSPEDRDWERYLAAERNTVRTGALLKIVGSDEMLDAAEEASEALMDVGWEYLTQAELHHGPVERPIGQVKSDMWNHVNVADREIDRLVALMRADLGALPLAKTSLRESQRERLPDAAASGSAATTAEGSPP